MDIANTINKIEFRDVDDLAGLLNFPSAASLLEKYPKIERYPIWFATKAYTEWAFGDLLPRISLANEVDIVAADFVRAFFLDFASRNLPAGSNLLVLGSTPASDLASLSFAKPLSMSIVYDPSGPPEKLGGLNVEDVTLIYAPLSSASRVLHQGRTGTLVLNVDGEVSGLSNELGKLFWCMREDSALILHGAADKVTQFINSIENESELKHWASCNVPGNATDGDYAISYLSVKSPTYLHMFVQQKPGAMTTTLGSLSPVPVYEEGKIRFVPREDVSRIAAETRTVAPARKVKVRSPIILSGPKHLEETWRQQFAMSFSDWMDPKEVACPALELHRLQDVRVAGTGALVTRDNFAVETSLQVMTHEQFAWWSNHVHRSDFRFDSAFEATSERILEPRYKVDETVLLIANPGFPMHYHFLFDLLPRLIFRSKDLADLPIALPDTVKGYQLHALENYYGVPRDRIKIYPVADSATVFADAYVTPTLVSDFWAMPETTVAARSALKHAKAPTDPKFRDAKRIYVSRTDTIDNRRLINERQLADSLSDLGFVEVFPGDFPYDEEMYLFQNAEVIIGPFGSGMSNMVFASPGATVVFLQPDSTNWRVLSLVMEQLQLNYGYIFGDSFNHHLRGHNTEWVIDVDQVLSHVRQLV